MIGDAQTDVKGYLFVGQTTIVYFNLVASMALF
jgi:hypothetical protein